MKTLNTQKNSYLSVKRFCLDLLKSPQLQVRLLPQCFEIDKIGLKTLSHKVELMLSANNIDCIFIPTGAFKQPRLPKIMSLLYHINIKVQFQTKPNKVSGSKNASTYFIKIYDRCG
jgi:hypothetical protein